jgi:hypothetical protein
VHDPLAVSFVERVGDFGPVAKDRVER